MAKINEKKKEETPGLSFFNPTPAKIELVSSKGTLLVIKAGDTVEIKNNDFLIEAQRNPKLIKKW